MGLSAVGSAELSAVWGVDVCGWMGGQEGWSAQAQRGILVLAGSSEEVLRCAGIDHPSLDPCVALFARACPQGLHFGG